MKWFEQNDEETEEPTVTDWVQSRRTNGIPIVVYRPVRCPHCGSKNNVVTSKLEDGVRRHKCRNCQRNFKSVESVT